MKKILAIALLILLVFIVGCSDDESYARLVRELEHQRFQINDLEHQQLQLRETLAVMQNENDSLLGTIGELEGVITTLEDNLDFAESALEDAPDETSNEIPTQAEEEPLFQGFTAPQIRQSLIENSGIILEALGGSEVIISEEDILVGPTSVLARVAIPVWDWPMDIDVVLLYHRTDVGINWRVFSYTTLHTGMQLAAPAPEEQQPLPTSEETVTLRFYQYSDWDQYIVIYDNVSRENWRADTISLMGEHTGINIRDIRYEGTRLYVDIFPMDSIPFNWGSTGGQLRTLTLVNSMASLPGVDEIVVLVGGAGGHWADHFDFSSPFNVR